MTEKKIIVREVFTAKPGMAGKLAKLFKRVFENDSNTRVMTDFIGNYNTVVMEMQVTSLAEFEKEMEEYKTGKHSRMNPEAIEEMSKYTEMYVSGKREVFQIIE